MHLLARVRRTIRRHQLAGRGTRVVAALSGGCDSVALAHLLRDLEADGCLTLVALAHFNHQLRATADRDEEFCRQVARALARPLVVDRGDVAGKARREKRSIEDAARAARHEFLERARVQCEADAIALGHTRDDQAETFLLRLLRGAGARGLASMHPRNGRVIRPLLECRRGDLKRFLESRGGAYVHDETNEDVSVPRNRVRAELMPFLRERFNPSVVDALADAADIAREDDAWMHAKAEALAVEVVARSGDQWLLDVDRLRAAPVALARLVVHGAMVAAAAGRSVGFAEVAQAVDLIRFDGPSFDAPGQHVERIDARLVLTGRPPGATGRVDGRRPPGSLFRYPLSIPGEVQLLESGCVISAEPGVASALPGAVPGSSAVAVVRRDRCSGDLAVRNRRPGDRFHPPGLGGGKKLQDFFVDRKVDRRARDLVPLVVDASDRIVWVAGHAIDEQFRVTDGSQAVLILRLKGLGGSA